MAKASDFGDVTQMQIIAFIYSPNRQFIVQTGKTAR